MMTVTLELSPEQEVKLRSYIARRDREGISQLLVAAFAPTVEVLLDRERDRAVENESQFETFADRLADRFATYFPSHPPVLSDYGISRAGIYEERL
ncbi:hypothetical protein IQ249_03405 [Lusitaniella coriacea LEGE 07157]|uniref:Uncharacterized protein n=1 Tax=Lusitaniella coriacea LEGE 07157 TaxID=945747 RepID=A0A8J7DLF1_9CYAN|nr:hypothetical protein [Lusitaniella coriacea]MBE9114938.1 hypothetical protein [Lusitaniella coriacea LEGE 07157]